MAGFLAGKNHAAAIGTQPQHTHVLQPRWLHLYGFTSAGWDERELGWRTGSNHEHPLLIGGEGLGIAVSKADGGRAICLPQENRSIGAAAFASLMEQYLLAVGRERYQHSAVKPGQFSFFTALESGEENLPLAIVDRDDCRAIGGNIVQRQVSRSRSQKPELAG